MFDWGPAMDRAAQTMKEHGPFDGTLVEHVIIQLNI